MDSEIAHLLHQSMSGLTPSYLADDINLVADSGRRLSNEQPSLHVSVPRTHNSFGDTNFAAARPPVWTNLPSYLRYILHYIRKLFIVA